MVTFMRLAHRDRHFHMHPLPWIFSLVASFTLALLVVLALALSAR